MDEAFLLTLSLICLMSLGALIWSASVLVSSCSRAAQILRISPLIIGLTIIAFGTSLPELVVSSRAAMEGHNGLVMGNVMGSNIANASFGLGAGLLFAAVALSASPILGLSMFAVTLLTALLLVDSELSRLDSAILLLSLIPLAWLVQRKLHETSTEHLPEPPAGSRHWHLLLIPLSLTVLLVSAEFLIGAAADIALGLGVSQQLIGLTLLALGTSLPEIAAAVAAAFQRQTELIVANLIGSNLFNLTTVLGVSGLILPLATEAGTELRDLGTMTLSAAVLAAVACRPPALRAGHFMAPVLLTGYLLYLFVIVRQADVL